MKKHITLLLSLLFFVTSLALAQDFEAPKKGAKIYAKEYTITLDSDTETTFDLWIVRSKLAKRAEFLTPSLLSSSGLEFAVSQDAENIDHYTVTVSAKDVDAGQYTTTVSARSTGTQQVTGTTLSFKVTPSKAVASQDGE